MLALALRIGGFLKEESKGRFLVNAWLRIMSGHGANPIFFNKENKDWTSITLTNPPRPTYRPPTPPPSPHLTQSGRHMCIIPISPSLFL